VKAPTLRVERELLRSGVRLLGAVDEVGRGALAGPVTVGIVVIDADCPPAPQGVRDSKLLTPHAREELAPLIRQWCRGWAVGSAEPGEIDTLGLTAALRLAGERALGELPTVPDGVLLDGSHDWLTRAPAQHDLFSELPDPLPFAPPRVVTRVKADLTCAAVAAASVLAKVHRDGVMTRLAREYPHYGWHDNKGYSAPEHLEALRGQGPCSVHRLSWRLPE